MKTRILAFSCLFMLALSSTLASVESVRQPLSHMRPIPLHASLNKVREFTLVAIEGKISPDVVRVKRGDLVRLKFKSKDGTYGIKIPALSVKGKATSEQPFYVEFAATSPGEYPIRCTKSWSFKRWSKNGKIVVE